jgi:hypothetical protein
MQEPDNAVRAAAHGDINLITLLMGAQGKGLQVQNHNGEWIDAIAEPDELVINVGDMLSRHDRAPKPIAAGRRGDERLARGGDAPAAMTAQSGTVSD